MQLAGLDDSQAAPAAGRGAAERADDIVAAVEDAERDDRLAAEERGGIGLVGDAAGIGGNLVGAEAEHGFAAAALQRDAARAAARAR